MRQLALIDSVNVAGDKAFKWEKEFPQVFDKGGFDVVIGNPPYGATLEQNHKSFLARKYQAFQGNHEIYFFFIELLNKIGSSHARSGLITPDTWIRIPQASLLRELMLKTHSIESIVAFGYSVFSDASVNAIVFIVEKGSQRKLCQVLHVGEKADSSMFDTYGFKEHHVSRWENSEDKQFQIGQNDADYFLIQKIENETTRAESVLDVSQGIVPYSTENLTKDEVKARIYHSQEKLDNSWGEWVQGRAVHRYGIDKLKAEYLKYGGWLHRPRKPKFFNGSRILIQEITGGEPPRISATYYNETLYHDPGIISCVPKVEHNVSVNILLAIINSKLISWYIAKTSPKGKRKTFPKVLIGDIRRIPIKIPSDSFASSLEKAIAEIVGRKSLELRSITSLVNLLETKYGIEVRSKRLLNWPSLEFKSFLKELQKAKVKLSLEEEAEWMEYFNKQKEKVQELQGEVDRLDKEIDRMVYELYGLTEEEIGIVENS